MEPMATSVSIFGDLCHSALNPLIKNCWLITMIIAASIICTSPIPTWLSVNHAGSGQPHIICPMEKYMSTIKNTTDAIRRFFNSGVCVSSSPVSVSLFSSFAFFNEAP